MEGQRRFQEAMARDRAHPFFSVNLTMSQLKILFALRLNGASGGQELAQIMGVSLATMTGIIDRLVASDYVSRREDPKDRRVRLIELTPQAVKLTDEMIIQGEEHQRRLLRRLTVAELGIIADASDIMQRVLAEDEPSH
jgi:DNA-binding MarR family transcriptional regulator